MNRRYLVIGRDIPAGGDAKRAYDAAMRDIAERAFQFTQERCGWSDEEKERIHAKLQAIPRMYGASDMLELVASVVGEEVDAKAKPNGGGSG